MVNDKHKRWHLWVIIGKQGTKKTNVFMHGPFHNLSLFPSHLINLIKYPVLPCDNFTFLKQTSNWYKYLPKVTPTLQQECVVGLGWVMPFASISLVTNIPTVGSPILRSRFQIRLALNKDKIYTADHKIRLIQTISSTSVLKSEIKCIKGTDIARWRKQLPSLYSIKPTEWNTKYYR